MKITYKTYDIPEGEYPGTITSNHVRLTVLGKTYGFSHTEYCKGIDIPITIKIVKPK